jgi:hypothetical protein
MSGVALLAVLAFKAHIEPHDAATCMEGVRADRQALHAAAGSSNTAPLSPPQQPQADSIMPSP